MKKLAFLAAASLVAAPALAQNSTGAAQPSPAPSQAQPPAAPAGEVGTSPATGPAPARSSPFGSHDSDSNGSLSQAEFTAMARAQSGATPPAEAQLTAAFQRIDADRNGSISEAEARAAQGGRPQGNPSQ